MALSANWHILILNTMTANFDAHSLEDTQRAGQKIAQQLTFPCCVYLQAAMGLGKTTLCKSIIQSLGYSGVVTSPTYNLIQEYPVGNGVIYHMDLYRLEEPDELAYLGLADLWTERSLFLVEWPEHGKGFLPKATAHISIAKMQDGSEHSRQITYRKPITD